MGMDYGNEPGNLMNPCGSKVAATATWSYTPITFAISADSYRKWKTLPHKYASRKSEIPSTSTQNPDIHNLPIQPVAAHVAVGTVVVVPVR